MEEFITSSELTQFLQLIKLHPISNHENRFEYLNKAIHHFCANIPFSNAFLIALPHEERKPLTWPEIKSLILNGFLQTQGFKVHLYNGSFNKVADNHPTIIAKDVLKEGDSYLVDVGSGFFISALCLNFESKSEIIDEAFTKYYMEWDQKKENLTMLFLNKEIFIPIIVFNLAIPYSSQEDIAFMNHIYCDPTKSVVHARFILILFPLTGVLSLINKKLKRQDENQSLSIEKELNSIEDFTEAVKEYFPLQDLETCKKAYLRLFE